MSALEWNDLFAVSTLNINNNFELCVVQSGTGWLWHISPLPNDGGYDEKHKEVKLICVGKSNARESGKKAVYEAALRHRIIIADVSDHHGGVNKKKRGRPKKPLVKSATVA